MVLVIFRSRLKPGVDAEYEPVAARMDAPAVSMPGYVAHKGCCGLRHIQHASRRAEAIAEALAHLHHRHAA